MRLFVQDLESKSIVDEIRPDFVDGKVHECTSLAWSASGETVRFPLPFPLPFPSL